VRACHSMHFPSQAVHTLVCQPIIRTLQSFPEDIPLSTMLTSSSGDLGHGAVDLVTQQQQQHVQLHSLQQQQALQHGSSQPELPKRGRGRPVGSKNKIAKAGNPLIPHVVIVNHGEVSCPGVFFCLITSKEPPEVPCSCDTWAHCITCS
jgi:hypothetical protein